jgi:hypothetical protein
MKNTTTIYYHTLIRMSKIRKGGTMVPPSVGKDASHWILYPLLEVMENGTVSLEKNLALQKKLNMKLYTTQQLCFSASFQEMVTIYPHRKTTNS